MKLASGHKQSDLIKARSDRCDKAKMASELVIDIPSHQIGNLPILIWSKALPFMSLFWHLETGLLQLYGAKRKYSLNALTDGQIIV